MTNARFQRWLDLRWNSANADINAIAKSGIARGKRGEGADGERGNVWEAAVLWNVRVAVAVPFAGSVKELSEQVISSVAGMPQVEEENPPEPVRPVWLVKVRMVVVDWPGAEIVTAVGLAETVNDGPGVTVSVKKAPEEK